jgi:hypothetical protein
MSRERKRFVLKKEGDLERTREGEITTIDNRGEPDKLRVEENCDELENMEVVCVRIDVLMN